MLIDSDKLVQEIINIIDNDKFFKEDSKEDNYAFGIYQSSVKTALAMMCRAIMNTEKQNAIQTSK